MSNSKTSVGSFFSTLGKSLQLPVAVLPLAGILVGIGLTLASAGEVGSMLKLIGTFLTNSGTSIFDNLPIVFALGLAIGFAKDHHGAAVLAAFIGHTVLLAGIAVLNPITSPDLPLKMGVFSGIFIGPIAGIVYNHFNNAKLPPFLAFFGGKRAVPIVTGGIAILLAVVFSFIWPWCQRAINYLGELMITSGYTGNFTYGFLNRMLLPVGLHQILNALVWFDFGSFTNAAGEVVRGDLWRYWAGDKTAGVFMVGFFPVMMFGLPAACAAMIVTAKKHRRAAVAGMLGSMALTSFLTGITEPIEFSFMFLAFPLYVIHAIFTGLSHVILNVLHARMGFTFSAGAIDYVLSYKLGEHQLLVLLVGVVYAVLYFLAFVAVIKQFNLKTPGREDDDENAEDSVSIPKTSGKVDANYAERSLKLIDGLGGKDNIKFLDACATRLRVDVVSNDAVNEAILKTAGAKGIFNKTAGSTQVVIGPEANDLADIMNVELKK